MGRFLLSLLLALPLCQSAQCALLSVTLEPSPVSVTGNNYGLFTSTAPVNQRISYAPLVNPLENEYAFAATRRLVDGALTEGADRTRVGSSRIDGTITVAGNTATITSMLYSYVESNLATSANQVIGRLRIDLGGSNFTWETRLPPSERGRSFLGSLKSDPMGVQDAPSELLAFQSYYFFFVYRATGAAPNVGGADTDPFSNSRRQFDLILNSTSGPIVPEPATGLVLAGLSLLAAGARATWRTKRKDGSPVVVRCFACFVGLLTATFLLVLGRSECP
jgi:hypothetical protein